MKPWAQLCRRCVHEQLFLWKDLVSQIEPISTNGWATSYFIRTDRKPLLISVQFSPEHVMSHSSCECIRAFLQLMPWVASAMPPWDANTNVLFHFESLLFALKLINQKCFLCFSLAFIQHVLNLLMGVHILWISSSFVLWSASLLENSQFSFAECPRWC